MSSNLSYFFRKYLAKQTIWYVLGAFFLMGTNFIIVKIPLIIAEIIDGLNHKPVAENQLKQLAVELAIFAITLMVIRTLSRISIFWPGRNIENELRRDFYQAILTSPQKFYQNQITGDLMSRATQDIMMVRVMLALGFLHSFNTIFLMISLSLSMFTLSVKLSFCCLGIMLVNFLVTKKFSTFLLEINRKLQASAGKVSEKARQILSAYSVFNTFEVAPSLNQSFAGSARQYGEILLQQMVRRVVHFPINGVIVDMGKVLILSWGASLVFAHELSSGQLVAFLSYVSLLVEPAVMVGWVVNAVQRGWVSLQRLMEVIQNPDQVVLKLDLVEKPKLTSVKMSNIGFNYVLDDKSFNLKIDEVTLKPGQVVGIFGVTGSGKTTIAQILAGVLAPQSGSFLIQEAGQKLPFNFLTSTMSEKSRWISYVPQQTFLFSDSLENNITMSKYIPGMLEKSLKFACLEKDLQGFEQGIKTLVGEKGVTLSGGQKQRVCLARAYYHNGPIFILDDVISAVDHKTERQLIHNMKTMLEDKIIIIISHRLSALVECDEILAIEDGKIAARGNHQTLLHNYPLYQRIWEYQQDHHEQSSPDLEANLTINLGPHHV